MRKNIFSMFIIIAVLASVIIALPVFAQKSCPIGQTYSLSCGYCVTPGTITNSCMCNAGFVMRTIGGVNQCVESCASDEVYKDTEGCKKATIINPATPQSGSISISDNLMVSGTVGVLGVGDIYLNDGKSIRIDKNGAAVLKMGNYDTRAGAEFKLLVNGSIQGNFLPSSGVACANDQILKSSGSAWVCSTASGGARQSAGLNIILDETTPNVVKINVNPDPAFNTLTVGGMVNGSRANFTTDIRSVTGTFSSDVSMRDLLARDIYTNSGNRLVVTGSAASERDTQFILDGIVGSVGKGVGLVIHSPETSSIAELLLRQGNSDRWALSARKDTSDFEIWRNNTTAGWFQAFKIDYNNGGITIPGFFSVINDMSVAGNVSFGGRAGIQKTLSVGANNYEADSSLLLARARYSSLGADEYLMELRTTTDANIPTQRLKIDRDGNLTLTGAVAASSLNISGIANASSLDVSGSVTGRSGTHVFGNADTTGQVVIRNTGEVDTMGTGSLIINSNDTNEVLRLDGNEIESDYSGGLYLQWNSDTPVHTGGNLDVEGIINAGTSDFPVTDSSGKIKMAKIAGEDFSSGSLASGIINGNKGYMVLGALRGYSCDNVCQSHSLVCSTVIEFSTNSVGFATCSNARTKEAVCFCKG